MRKKQGTMTVGIWKYATRAPNTHLEWKGKGHSVGCNRLNPT